MENLGVGLEITVIGMIVVVSSLLGLGAIIRIIKFFEDSVLKDFNEQNNDIVLEEGSRATKSANQETTQEQEQTGSIAPAKIAAISGAITAYLEDEEGNFVITSIKSISNKWKLSGRRKLMAISSNMAKNKKIDGSKLKRKKQSINQKNYGGVRKNA